MSDKPTGSEFFNKAKLARKLIGLTQRQLAADLSRAQRDISFIENGQRDKLVPHDYMAYLHQKGIDLNWLYEPDPAEEVSREASFRKAFRTEPATMPSPQGVATYFLVRYDEAGRLVKTPEQKLVAEFDRFPLPGLAAGKEPLIGFVLGKDTPPWQAEDIVICRSIALSALRRGIDYLVIAEGRLSTRRIEQEITSGSERYVHWIDDKMPKKNIQQVWEPLRSIVGSIGNPRGLAPWEQQERQRW
ncbi:helix-turn-helix transcriptional regulator [Roseivirga sp. BDSF3-8]|uniref:helix-turn-helix domain-containing protein n=1 Tax=Roseivirga sp. BDSF3-8 TaxID=3241598 RepID=UPI00353243A1